MTEMTCAELVEQITDYLEGTLGPDRMTELRAHLEYCEGCRNYLHQMVTTLRLLRSVPPAVLPPSLEKAVLDEFRRRSDGTEDDR